MKVNLPEGGMKTDQFGLVTDWIPVQAGVLTPCVWWIILSVSFRLNEALSLRMSSLNKRKLKSNNMNIMLT